MSYKDHQKVLGHNIVGVGGQGALVGAADPHLEEPKPVFFHALPESCWAEILNAFRPNSVIDLTASDEALPLACVKGSIPYVGFCMTEFHKEALWRRLARSALRDAADEEGDLYDEDLANTIKHIGDDAAGRHGRNRHPQTETQSEGKQPHSGERRRQRVRRARQMRNMNGGSDADDDDADLSDGPEAEDRWEALARHVEGWGPLNIDMGQARGSRTLSKSKQQLI